MMIIMYPGAPKEQIDAVIAEIERQELSSHPIFGVEQTIIGAVGDGHYVAKEIFEALPGVMEVQRISKPYKLASRQFHEKRFRFFNWTASISAAQKFQLLQDHVQLSRASKFLKLRMQLKKQAQMRCAVESSSRALHPIPSRDLAKKDLNISLKRVNKQECPSLSK